MTNSKSWKSKEGKFLEDTLFSLLSVIIILPLNCIFRKCTVGYTFTKS